MDSKILRYLQRPEKIIAALGTRGLMNFVNDRTYLKCFYEASMEKKLDLENPKTFNEKLQWLKLYDRNPNYTQLVDKYEVRKHIEATIGDEYLVPLLGIWENVDQIEWEALPNQFVLKCTHDSGGVIICKDKSKFDVNLAKKKLKKSLSRNYYYAGREWPYKNVKPRIICEKYMVDDSIEGINDYKFYCFHGVPKVMFIATERESNVKYDFYDLQFQHLPIGLRNSKKKLNKPTNLTDMVNLAKILSENMPHVRIDFYNVNGKIYFGEFTFYSGGGIDKFDPNHEFYDELFGSWIQLT